MLRPEYENSLTILIKSPFLSLSTGAGNHISHIPQRRPTPTSRFCLYMIMITIIYDYILLILRFVSNHHPLIQQISAVQLHQYEPSVGASHISSIWGSTCMTIETNTTNPFQHNQIHPNGKANRLNPTVSCQMRTHGVTLIRWKVIHTIFQSLKFSQF